MLTAEKTEYKRYELWFANLPAASGSIQRGKRPVLIVSNDMGNRHSPTVQVASVTSVNKKDMPTHVKLNASECGLRNDSTVLFEQMSTIQKDQLLWRIGSANTYVPQLDRALLVQVGCINAWE